MLSETNFTKGRSGSLPYSFRKLWWSAWYFPKERAEGKPIEKLQNMANILLVDMDAGPA